MRQSELKTRLCEYIKRSHLQESSVEILQRSIRWFEELVGQIPPGRIDYGHIDDFRSWLKKGRAGTTANTYMGMAKGFFIWLYERRYIEKNPFVGIRRYPAAERQFEQYEIDEIRRILKIADIRWKAIVSLALCSMRRAEILNLHVSDVDFEKNEIHIRPKAESETTWPWSIKNHNEALVGIDEQVAQMLIQLADMLEGSSQPYIILKPKYWRLNLEKQKAGTLRHADRNMPWGNFTRDFKSLLRRARVKEKRFHDLRGTFCTERYRAGFELIDLQYLMRHASIQTTARYIQIAEKKRLIAKSAAAFTKKYYVSNVS
jgi:integrase